MVFYQQCKKEDESKLQIKLWMFTLTYMHTDYVEVILYYVEVNWNNQIREYSLASFNILFYITSLMLGICRINMQTILL